MRRRGRPRHPDVLTPREQEVLALIRDELSNEEIAGRLGISVQGVKYHVTEILGKLGVQNRREAAQWQPEERPWWQAALAPLAFWRDLGPVSLIAVAVIGILIVAGLGALAWGVAATAGDGGPRSAGPSVEIFSVQPFSEEGAWVLTRDALLRTDDGAASWKDVTPVVHAGPAGSQRIATAFFLNGLEGWAAANAYDTTTMEVTVSVFRTRDGGESWEGLPPGPTGYRSGAESLFFFDSNTGWLGLGPTTMGGFRYGSLYRTTDGGATWSEVTVPTNDPFLFTTPTDGWVAGDRTLSATSDGGETWQEKRPPGASPEPRWVESFVLPRFFDPLNGVTGMETRDGPGQAFDLHFFRTDDGGVTWTSAGQPLEIAPGGWPFSTDPGPVAFAGPNDWFVAADRLYATMDAGETWSVVDTDLDVSKVEQLAFTTPKHGWAIWFNMDCAVETACFDDWRLLNTEDRGRTWDDVALP